MLPLSSERVKKDSRKLTIRSSEKILEYIIKQSLSSLKTIRSLLQVIIGYQEQVLPDSFFVRPRPKDSTVKSNQIQFFICLPLIDKNLPDYNLQT